MKLLNANRRSGKTTFLVRLLKMDSKAVIITGNEAMVDCIVAKHPELKGRVVAARRVDTLHGRDVSKIYIDELEHVIHDLLRTRAPIELATSTMDIID